MIKEIIFGKKIIPPVKIAVIRGVEKIKISSQETYEAGTLRYTTVGLISLFGWLLWGDFCFTIFESIMPRFLPLFMKDLNASNGLIGIMSGSIAGVLNLGFLPVISVWSDRYRGRWGRRIPFLLWGSLFTALSLFLLGYSKEIGIWLHPLITAQGWMISDVNVTLVMLCVFAVMYHFFNMVMVNMYNCLLRDVVPQAVMARFLSLFRIVGTGAGVVFSRYMFGYVDTHRKIIFLGVGLIYLISFLLMCWRVREGEYPPTSPLGHQSSLWLSIKTYLIECFSVPLYFYFFIVMVFGYLSACASPFAIFFYRDTLGLTLDNIGKMQGWILLFQMIVYVPLGFLCDKVKPIRVAIVSLVLIPIVLVFSFIFISDWNSLMIWSLVSSGIGTAWALSSLSLMMSLFPQEKYAQYSSAINVLGCASMIFGNYVAGLFLTISVITGCFTCGIHFLWCWRSGL